MKTSPSVRVSVASLSTKAIACSDPIESVIPLPRAHPGSDIPTDHDEYHTSVTTWTHECYGKFVGFLTQTAGDLSTADVFVLRNGERIPIDREFDATSGQASFSTYGEYIWASYRNNVLLLNYIGMTQASTPPFPLDVVIVH